MGEVARNEGKYVRRLSVTKIYDRSALGDEHGIYLS